jgi:hypothetical protein
LRITNQDHDAKSRQLMRKTILGLVISLCASAAQAQDCPAFFRFVDFGQVAKDSSLNRGGPVLRAEGFDGRALLLPQRATCLAAAELSKDGRGNPIPIVSRVFYDPSMAGLPVSELFVATAQDMTAQIAALEAAHQADLSAPNAIITQGATFRCAFMAGAPSLSCQIVSPFGSTQAPILRCDSAMCTLPVVAINDRIFAGARWPNPIDPEQAAMTAEDATDKVALIHDFIVPLSSGF